MSSYNVISNGVHTFVKPPSLYCLPQQPTTSSCLGYKMAFTHFPPVNSDPLPFIYFKLLNSLQRSGFWECFGMNYWYLNRTQNANTNKQKPSAPFSPGCSYSWQLRPEVEKGSCCLVICCTSYLTRSQNNFWILTRSETMHIHSQNFSTKLGQPPAAGPEAIQDIRSPAPITGKGLLSVET